MKIIIPLAGIGTRLRPHTHSKAKPLFYLAGNTVLGHIFEQIKDVNVEEIIFIVGYLGDQIKEYVEKNYDHKCTFIEQKEMLGQAHAIYLAKEHLKDDDDIVIWFVDTISDANLNYLKESKADGVLYVKEVEDPRRFGQIQADSDNKITKIAEKADPPISNLVNIGIYYIKDSKKLMDSIKVLMDKHMQTKGEYYLMDAFQIMINNGSVFEANTINVWEDCGKADAVIATNKYLIEHVGPKCPDCFADQVEGSVFVEESEINSSKIGPYVSVAKGSTIKNSKLIDCIIGADAVVENCELTNSIIGARSKVCGVKGTVNLGEDCEIQKLDSKDQ